MGKSEGLWKTATYWDLGKQTAGQAGKLEACWDNAVKELGLENSLCISEATGNPGAKLSTLVDVLNERVHANPQTIIHGDPKAANFFFRRSDSTVAVVDFQWTGYGRCTVDLAYFITAGINPDLAKKDLERMLNNEKHESVTHKLLSHYESSFKEFWERLHEGSELPKGMRLEDGLMSDYQESFCDLMRVALVDHYGPNFKAETLEKRENLPENARLSYNAYNKSRDVGRWVLALLYVF